jgi:nicotinic acid mononucleotide adenylyltransferase
MLVTERPGYERDLGEELKDWLVSRELGDSQSLRATPSGGVLFMQQALVDISSTSIRARVRGRADHRGISTRGGKRLYFKRGAISGLLM